MAEKVRKHKKALQGLPFPPLRKIDTDEPITEERLVALLDATPAGVSVCVRSARGHEDRGGYFFHFRRVPSSTEAVEVLNFESLTALKFDQSSLTRFVNHGSGLRFDQEMFNLCQSVVNFRLDPQQSPEQEEQAETLEPQ